jgi:hypothetical protein
MRTSLVMCPRSFAPPARTRHARRTHDTHARHDRARLERPFRANCGSGPRSSGHFARQLQSFRANCGSGPGSSGHFEPTAAPGQARAAISSQQRLRARLEVANVGRCGVFEPGE